MKHLKRILWVVAVLAMIAALSATAMAETEAPTLTFDKTSYEIDYGDWFYLGTGSGHLTVTGEPGTLTWTSSDAMTVYVYSSGQVVGKKPGKATITVTGEKGGSATTEVIVKDNPVKTIVFNPTALTVNVNNSDELEVSITHADETAGWHVGMSSVKFTSSDPDILTCSESASGYEDNYYIDIYAHSEGTATITGTVTNLDGSIITGTATVTVNKPALTSIKFARDKYTVKWNQYKYLKLNVKPVGTPYGDDVSFVSSDEQVVTVDSDGEVYGRKPGEATITATYNPDPSITATTTVVVEAKAMKKLSLNRTAITLSDMRTTINRAIQFKVEPAGAYYDQKETYWESSDTDIVDVYYISGDKEVALELGGKYGTATVTAHVYDGANWYTASCEVTVISKDKGISLDITKKTIYLHAAENQSDSKDYFWITASNDAGDEYYGNKVTWSTSKKKVATVNKNGKVKAVKAGKATITATGPDGSTATCKVTVKKNLIKKITGNKLITMRIGGSDDVNNYLVFSPSYYTLYDPTLTYASSDDSVVSVGPDGTLRANGIGTAKITVKAQDGSKKKFTLKVKVIDARE